LYIHGGWGLHIGFRPRPPKKLVTASIAERALVMKVNIQSLLGLWEVIHHGVREVYDERERERTTATGAVEALKHPRGLARQQDHADR
jgi:hypothetical protein